MKSFQNKSREEILNEELYLNRRVIILEQRHKSDLHYTNGGRGLEYSKLWFSLNESVL